MTDWKKMSIEATEHKFIVGIFYRFNEEDSEDEKFMDILYFNGIDNRWNCLSRNIRGLMMKDIQWYIPLPQVPKQ